MRPNFIGSGVALVTPFNKDGEIDFRTFSKLIEFQIANKTDAIIVCGTTGEGSTVTVRERLKLFSLAAQQVNGRVPVIAGTGSNSTSFSADLMKEAEKCGIDAHLSVTPYYNKTSQEGIVRHYYSLAENAQKPVIIYNVPTRTGMNIQPETYKRLSEHENIVAVKEADTNISKLQKSIELTEGKLDFYVGNDDLISVGCCVGCIGVISVLSNILPCYTHKFTKLAIEGKTKESFIMQKDILDLIDALFIDVNPIPVKAAINHLFGISKYCRLPLCDLSERNEHKLLKAIERHRDKFSMENTKILL